MDAFALMASLGEVRHLALGTRIRRAAWVAPDTILLRCEGAEGPVHLRICADPSAPALYALPQDAEAIRPPGTQRVGHWPISRWVPSPPLADELPPRRRVPSPFDLRPLQGTTLLGIQQEGVDRVVRLRFGTGAGGLDRILVAELIARRANLILLDGTSSRILGLLRPEGNGGARRLAPGEAYLPPPRGDKVDPTALQDADGLARLLLSRLGSGAPLWVALTESLAGVSSLWARELIVRAGADRAPSGPRMIGLLWCALRALLDDTAAMRLAPRIVLQRDGAPDAVVPCAMVSVPPDRQFPCPSMGDAMRRRALLRREWEERRLLRQQVDRTLRTRERRVRSRITKLEAQAGEYARADEWKVLGELLVAHRAALRPGLPEATVPDYYGSPGATRTIPLDPALSVRANAERYFKRFRKARRGTAIVSRRLAEAREELFAIADLRKRFEAAASPEDLRALARELEIPVPAREGAPGPKGQGARVRGKQKPAMAAGAPRGIAPGTQGHPPKAGKPLGPGPWVRGPRRFRSSDGHLILVGRDNRGNDELTLEIARPRDLWLHVEGRGGSHVVLRTDAMAGGIPRQTLVEAAQLAAYYSQARGERKVPVTYTQKKYVRKPKGSKPGLVTITHAKTLFVNPDPALVQRLALKRDEGP